VSRAGSLPRQFSRTSDSIFNSFVFGSYSAPVDWPDPRSKAKEAGCEV
jgi:hypothetical protein